jgi:hypothetical protein
MAIDDGVGDDDESDDGMCDGLLPLPLAAHPSRPEATTVVDVRRRKDSQKNDVVVVVVVVKMMMRGEIIIIIADDDDGPMMRRRRGIFAAWFPIVFMGGEVESDAPFVAK